MHPHVASLARYRRIESPRRSRDHVSKRASIYTRQRRKNERHTSPFRTVARDRGRGDVVGKAGISIFTADTRYELPSGVDVWRIIVAQSTSVPVTRRNQSTPTRESPAANQRCINKERRDDSFQFAREKVRPNESFVPSTCESRRHEYHVGTLERESL